MQLDVFTAMVGLSALLVLLGLQLLYFWTRDRHAPWLGWWATAFFLGGAGVSLYVPRGQVSDFISIGLANAFLLGAFGFSWTAARVFEQRTPMLSPIIVAAGVWLAASLHPAFLSDLPARVVLLSLLNAGFCLATFLEFWSGRSEHLPSRVPAALIMMVYAAYMITRIPMAWSVEFPVAGSNVSTAVGVGGLIGTVLTSCLTMLVISMTKERLELEQRCAALADPLTGLLNRRTFLPEGERLAAEARSNGAPFSVLVMDIDNFKSVNDRFGHDVGDQVLVAFSTHAKARLRSDDLPYRTGGEEFCFLLPKTHLAEATALAEGLRREFAGHSIIVPGGEVRATVSVGIATANGAVHQFSELLAAADMAVYDAKSRGRNRVLVAAAA